eukprot:614987-Pyramimonas_sp.AAC.1
MCIRDRDHHERAAGRSVWNVAPPCYFCASLIQQGGRQFAHPGSRRVFFWLGPQPSAIFNGGLVCVRPR